MRRFLPLLPALALLLPLLSETAAAQSFTRGVSAAFCSSQGGRFTYTGQVGTDVGECFVPARLPSAGTGGFSGAGRAGAALGAAGAGLGMAAGVLSMMDSMDRGGGGSGGPVHPQVMSNAANLAGVPFGPTTVPSPGTALADLANDPAAFNGGFTRTYAMLGVLNDPALIQAIASRCAGSTQMAQMVCVEAQMVEALFERSPQVRRQCGDKEEPMRSICAARVQMQEVGISAGECIGACPVRMRAEYLQAAKDETNALRRAEGQPRQ